VLGDLDEEFARFQMARGRTGATAWYWSQAIRSVIRAHAPTPVQHHARGTFMLQLPHDLRHGIRQLRSQWSVSVTAIVTLAIGIGLSTSLFTVVDAAWFRPLPFPDPEQLVRADVVVEERDGAVAFSPSLNDVRAWRTSGRAITHGAVDRGARRVIVDAGGPERVSVSLVSEDYFEMLSVAPVLGRTFVADDMSRARPLVVMLGHEYWMTRFGGDLAVIGRTLRLNNLVAEIIGVVPAGFYPSVAVWRPFQNVPESFRGHGAPVVLRLRAGMSFEAASTILAEEARAAGGGRVVGVSLTSLHEDTVMGRTVTLQTLAAAVAAVLLLACVNVAGLLLARGSTRRREIAVRASLGGSRSQLIRMLLAESLVLAVAGGVAGVLLAWVSLDGLVALLPLSIPDTTTVTLNTAALAFAVAASLTTTVIVGMVPAIRLSRVRLTDALSVSDRRTGGSLSRRGGQTLIAAEVALAVMLVAGAGLMVRSFVRLAGVDLGFDANNFLAVQVAPVDPTPGVSAAYYPALLDAVRALPEVVSAGAATQLPLGGGRRAGGVVLPGGERMRIDVRLMTPGFFETLGIPVRHGLLPTDADRTSGRRVVVVNETTARQLFGDEPAVGRVITFDSFDSETDRPFEIVAVVADTLPNGARSPRRANVYTLYEGTEEVATAPFVVYVRPRGNAPGLGDRLRATAASLGMPVVVDSIRPGNAFVSDNIAVPRRQMQLLGLLGAVGLALAMVGIFSVTAFAVSRRTTEIGVRMALGARPAVVVRTIIGDATWPIALGLVTGLAGSYLASRLVASSLFETSPHDVVTFVGVTAVLAVASLGAAWLPARKAALIDPVSAMRAD
jgi:predicted permease